MENKNEKYKYYVHDLGCLIRENALEAKKEKDKSKNKDNSYETGRLMAYLEVVSLMQDEGGVFEIPLEEMCLEGIEPERDLL